MTKLVPRKHPATFTASVLEAVQPWLDAEAARRFPDGDGKLRIWDPFAGTGKLHELHDENGDETWGGELEAEWACWRPDRTIIADALRPPFRPGTFHVVFTSPCYGNRFADTYDGRDGTKRYTYRVYLDRMPTAGSATIMAWGAEYRRFHEDVFRANLELLDDDGLLVVNMSNHLRTLETGKPSIEQHVVEWYVSMLARLGLRGLRLVGVVPVPTPRNANGANADVRAETEFLIVCRRPPGRELRLAASLLSEPVPLSLF